VENFWIWKWYNEGLGCPIFTDRSAPHSQHVTVDVHQQHLPILLWNFQPIPLSWYWASSLVFTPSDYTNRVIDLCSCVVNSVNGTAMLNMSQYYHHCLKDNENRLGANEGRFISSVSTVTRLRSGRPEFNSQRLQGLPPNASRQTLGSTEPPVQWVPGTLSPEVERPGREADQSSTSSAEVRNAKICTPLPPYVFMAKYLSYAQGQICITCTFIFKSVVFFSVAGITFDAK
jgi:hypothetical protein